MAQAEMICPKCRQRMHVGFVPDRDGSGVGRGIWIEGLPRPWRPKLGWFGSKLWDARPITTYRCPACRYLESYAE